LDALEVVQQLRLVVALLLLGRLVGLLGVEDLVDRELVLLGSLGSVGSGGCAGGGGFGGPRLGVRPDLVVAVVRLDRVLVGHDFFSSSSSTTSASTTSSSSDEDPSACGASAGACWLCAYSASPSLVCDSFSLSKAAFTAPSSSPASAVFSASTSPLTCSLTSAGSFSSLSVMSLSTE